MKKLAIAAALAAATAAPAYAADPAPAAAPAPAAGYSTAATDIGTLIDNPATKAVLDKHMPGFSANPQIDMARSMTLKQVQGFAADQMTDEVLAKIDADLAKIPPAK
jgi:opacity protein-like surface antigen